MPIPDLKAPHRGESRRAFTLIEVLVVVAIIALLISILLPSLKQAREVARRAVCAARLHNMGLAVQEYAMSNKGKLIECRERQIQVAINPKWTSFDSNPQVYDHVDWQKAAKKYHLDKELWECPNRQGTFGYEGDHPEMSTQELESAGYKVLGTGYNQWMLGYRGDNLWPSRSPVDNNAKPHWALAADSNLEVDRRWGGGRPGAFSNIPPHPDADGKPAGGNVLTMDCAVT